MDFLDARQIEYMPIDMCANAAARPEMLEMLPEETKGEGMKFLPPQVFNGSDYCGDFEKFFDAREMDLIYSFFKLDPPAGSSEYNALHPPVEEPEEVEEVEEVEEEEEVEEVEEEALHGEQAVEDTPMDMEGGEEKMALFGALAKTEGEGAPEDEDSPLPENQEVLEEAEATLEQTSASGPASEVAEEDEEIEFVEEPEEVQQEATEEAVDLRDAEEFAEQPEEQQSEQVDEQPVEEIEQEPEVQQEVEDTAEVDEYKSDDE